MEAAITFEAPPVLASVAVSNNAFSTFCREHAVPEYVESNLVVCTEEILLNVIRHGNATTIWVAARLSDGRIDVQIEDDGKEFNPLDLPAPDVTAPLEARRLGGLGVYMVRKLMSNVAYEHSGGRNRLTMSVSLASAPA